MRIGFDDDANFDRILGIVNESGVDLLTVHGRTVREMYRSDVHYDRIAHAAARSCCPVLANGNVTSAPRAAQIVRDCGAFGVMIGRHAIRNPWIFRQCRERFSGLPVSGISLRDVRGYVERLYRATRDAEVPERAHVNKMKKYLNFVGQGVDPDGAFLRDMRRAESESGLFEVCDRHLLSRPDAGFAPEPYPGVIARPNCETPAEEADGCSLETVTA
jgi:tRNA-dihydrouridine synthase